MKQSDAERIRKIVSTWDALQHRLVHDYDGINWSIIVEVIFDEMDDFVKSIENIL